MEWIGEVGEIEIGGMRRQEVNETVLSLEYVLLCNITTSNIHNFETIRLTMVLNRL